MSDQNHQYHLKFRSLKNKSWRFMTRGRPTKLRAEASAHGLTHLLMIIENYAESEPGAEFQIIKAKSKG